jgi:cytochrome P450
LLSQTDSQDGFSFRTRDHRDGAGPLCKIDEEAAKSSSKTFRNSATLAWLASVIVLTSRPYAKGSIMRADFSSQTYFRNPAAELERMRSAGPVVQIRFPMLGNVWTTTTQDLADRVLKDSETFTIRHGVGGVAGLQWWMPRILRTLANHMLSMDEPDHTRLRDIVDEAFRRRAILEMEPRILAIAEELASALFADGSPADLVERYAQTLPLSVICELLGLPLADRPMFTAWAGRFTRFTGAIGVLSLVPNILAMRRYLQRQLEAARENGGTGLIAELVRVEKEGGQISRDEMVAMVFLLLFAGHETTTHLISGSVYELLKNPTLRDWLEEDWSRAPLAVEEFLRFISPVQFTKPRFVGKDVELGGVRLKEGEKIMPMVAAANFDPQANQHPEKLDLTRKPNRHLAFGTGIHFCLGHQLARIEGVCALKALFRRWPKLVLAVDESRIKWRKRPGLKAIEQLPVAIPSAGVLVDRDTRVAALAE